MPRKMKGLSAGSVLVLLLSIAAIIGILVFLQAAGNDSPAASMRLEEIAGAVGQALLVPDKSATALPEQMAQLSAGIQSAAPQANTAFDYAPVSVTMTLGGMLRFESDIVASQSFVSGGQSILFPLTARLQADLIIMGSDQAVAVDKKANDTLMPIDALDLIKQAGINALVLTGGYILDGGLAPAQRTLDALDARGIRAIGLGDGKVTTFRVNGLSIACLHASDRLSAAGRKATRDNERAAYMIAYDLDQMVEQVTSLKERADIVVVSLNWQSSSGQTPTADQRTAAHRLGQAGADLIVGMGGEQVQNMELYQIKGSGQEGRDVLIAYGLGNILTENRSKRERLSGTLLHIALTYDPRQKSVHYDSLRYSPTYVRKWTASGKQHFQVLLSAEAPPDDMSKTQRDQMSRCLQLIRTAFAGTPATLQR